MSIKLSDYKPYLFEIPNIQLEFFIYDKYVKVISHMNIEPLGDSSEDLRLKGVELELEEILINGERVEENSYLKDSSSLAIYRLPQKDFELTISCIINPFENSSLEGLYSSHDLLVTQCEAEGFRRICYHPDRPDVLSKYRVCVEADVEKYPVILSNGNLIEERILEKISSRRTVIWDDPFPKPSYLFALVAGDLKEVRSSFNTASGRPVSLRLHVEDGDQAYTTHAIESLKRAMKWDESIYGLEYDLDEFNIVAVRHFNMGAMENKSLNIFNSKLVLANNSIATDYELERIESVIAHEYFHNWTGNRVTCRDWFQLSLKEGLTVFRDQSFTSDLHSEALKRIDDVQTLRNTQFREDAGPTAHAVKPSEYVSIDNFYTTTIYEKGAEIIRMLYTILGHKNFMSGINLYIKRFDGRAATTEDFVESIVDGSNMNITDIPFNIDKFSLWYYQAGTPNVLIKRHWNPRLGTLTINLKQETSGTPGQPRKSPLVIPIRIAMIGSSGRLNEEQLFILDEFEKEVLIKDLPRHQDPPALSIFRGFSAPVKCQIDFSLEETIQLLMLDDDPFSRWEAGQYLMRKVVLARCSCGIDNELEDGLISAFEHLISSIGEDDPGLLATLLTIPCLSELESYQEQIDPVGLYDSRMALMEKLGKVLGEPLRELLDKCRFRWGAQWPEGQGDRKLTGLIWVWLAAAGDAFVFKEAVDLVKGNSMTLARAALNALQPFECSDREIALKAFFDRWKDQPVILDTWFRLEASSPRINGLDRVRELMCHPLFDEMAPNAVRAVLGGLVSNTKVFHSVDGSGYIFMANQLVDLDKRNPITASRMIKVFAQHDRYINPYKDLMNIAIEDIAKSELSSNTREIVKLIKL